MGLTRESVGINALDLGLHIERNQENDRIIALAGNPNVGKSTVFNGLTGLNQHTGNWPGKTVSNAQGTMHYQGKNYIFVDIPGTYSLMAHSKEEEVARDFICFGNPDVVVIVCDATCLQRNLNLVLQTIEITNQVIVCVNLLDEAKKKKIEIDLHSLQRQLNVPVIGTIARNKKSLETIPAQIEALLKMQPSAALNIRYDSAIEEAIQLLQEEIDLVNHSRLSSRWIALRFLDYDEQLSASITNLLHYDLLHDEEFLLKLKQANQLLLSKGFSETRLKDAITASLNLAAKAICLHAVQFHDDQYQLRDRKIDRILTSRITGFPIMILLLALVFWLTISGANVPSAMLSTLLFWVEDQLMIFANWLNIPPILSEMLILGVYRVLAWVISVMLPPMAIFFPLFTLLEDLGYLPRIAFNLDKTFKKCCACGKQALTMCMGFGCNAAGIVGCRIIDSPRERLIAMITNNFVPCNGRFPTIIAIITMFFTVSLQGVSASIVSALLLTAVVLLGIIATFFTSWLLSNTLLKGEVSSFTLELPPYRKPQFGKILIHSIFDRTLFVLGRAVAVAIPAGMIIWLFANVSIQGVSILHHCSQFLDPFAQIFGLDGIILIAFILGFPANEIVIPIMIMAYMSTGVLVEFDSLIELKALLVANGWTWITAVSTMLFCLMHWPCSTTFLTIRKESGSLKWTLASFLIPTFMGLLICFLFTTFARLFI